MSDGGKGSTQRPTNYEAFDKHFENIFGKKPPKEVSEAVRNQVIDADNLASDPNQLRERVECPRCGKVMFIRSDTPYIHTCTPKEVTDANI